MLLPAGHSIRRPDKPPAKFRSFLSFFFSLTFDALFLLILIFCCLAGFCYCFDLFLFIIGSSAICWVGCTKNQETSNEFLSLSLIRAGLLCIIKCWERATAAAAASGWWWSSTRAKKCREEILKKMILWWPIFVLFSRPKRGKDKNKETRDDEANFDLVDSFFFFSFFLSAASNFLRLEAFLHLLGRYKRICAGTTNDEPRVK